MTRMPSFDEIRDDFERGVRTAEQLVEHPFRRRDAAPQTPATAPATMAAAPAAAPPQEDTMSLATLEDDIKNDLTEGAAYVEQWIGRVKQAAPGIIATSEAVAGSTVGQLAEIFLGRVLPPDVETELLSVVKRYVTSFGQPAAPAQATFTPVPAPAQ